MSSKGNNTGNGLSRSKTKLEIINTDTIKVMQDGFLRCAICLDMVDEPKCLDCLHKFCAKCLDDYVKSKYKSDKK